MYEKLGVDRAFYVGFIYFLFEDKWLDTSSDRVKGFVFIILGNNVQYDMLQGGGIVERIQRLLRLVFRNIYYYRVDYIRTFAAIRLFQLFIVLPLISLLFSLILDFMGVQSITEQNMLQLVTHPLGLVLLAFIVLIILLFVYYEMGFNAASLSSTTSDPLFIIWIVEKIESESTIFYQF